ncbi:MAG: tetratricopeptide repeat protein, partial [Candidatus Kariarchaeaceae archaeon]
MKEFKDIELLIRKGMFDQVELMINEVLSNQKTPIIDKLEFELLYGELRFRKGQYLELISNMTKTLENCIKVGNYDLEFQCLFLIANSNLRIGELEDVNSIISKMKEILNEIQNKDSSIYISKKAKFILVKAAQKRYLSQFEDAIDYYNQCILLRGEINDHYGIAEPWNHIGIIYDQIGDHVK